MLKGINKLLTGDLLKILCDMGHGDELIIADANFPAEALATRLIRLLVLRFLNNWTICSPHGTMIPSRDGGIALWVENQVL